jgi:dihydrofolate reductase
LTVSSPDPTATSIGFSSRGGLRHLYIDGGATIQRFLERRLIDESTITIIPVLLGAGIPILYRRENALALAASY